MNLVRKWQILEVSKMQRTGDREMSFLFRRVLEMQNLQVCGTHKSIRGGDTTIREITQTTWKRITGFNVGDLVRTPYGIGLIQEHSHNEYLIFFLFPPLCSKVLKGKELGVPSKWERRLALHKSLWIAGKFNWRKSEITWTSKRI